jgi:hypothetical protein
MLPSAIATLATGTVKADLQLFLFSLGLWNKAPTVYLICDKEIAEAIPTMGYSGKIYVKQGLDRYTGLNRQQMEKTPDGTANLWVNFMLEKATLLEWALESAPDVLFCDSDICFTAPLFEIPEDAKLAVSRHEIRPQDEARFGAFNGGMIWVTSKAQVALWRSATTTSRFFEQASIEDLVAADPGAYMIPRQNNYGWWRLFQGVKPPHELAAEWSSSTCIKVAGQPLGSIHTHFGEVRDAATMQFNKWVLSNLALDKRPKAKELLTFIRMMF